MGNTDFTGEKREKGKAVKKKDRKKNL